MPDDHKAHFVLYSSHEDGLEFFVSMPNNAEEGSSLQAALHADGAANTEDRRQPCKESVTYMSLQTTPNNSKQLLQIQFVAHLCPHNTSHYSHEWSGKHPSTIRLSKPSAPCSTAKSGLCLGGWWYPKLKSGSLKENTNTKNLGKKGKQTFPDIFVALESN